MKKYLALAAVSFAFLNSVHAADWARFRGPNGSGVIVEDKAVPPQWGESSKKWTVELPGPGHSSPIVVGDRVFLTCWTGYGLDQENVGEPSELRLHLLSIDRSNGNVVWSKAIEPTLPEELYAGMFAQHGYASHTPASDGEKVFAFFGKSGVVAFDLEGNLLWRQSVGSQLDERHWGSAASPILYKNLVIVNAAIEDNALVALDKSTGKEVWKATAETMTRNWGTPVIAKVDDERTDIVISVPNEIWGLNPDTGKLRWYCDGVPSNGIKASIILDGGVAFALGDREGGALAVKIGGKGDTKSNILWTEKHRGGTSSPICHERLIYWIDGGFANCIDATTGAEIYRERLSSATDGAERQGGGDDGAGASRRRGGFGGGSDYASPVISGNHLFQVTRAGEVIVLELGKEFKRPARMKLGTASEKADFSATPAISNGEMFIRSTKHLYCIGGAD